MYPGTHSQTIPDTPAFVMAGSGEAVTYRELDERSNRLAHLFRRAGLQRGDHIALLMENNPRFFEICWAAQRAGLYYTAISSRLTVAEAAYIINDCGARAFLTSSAKRDLAEAVAPETPDVEVRLMVDGTATGYDAYEAAVADLPTTNIADESQGMDMLYSSGTTGRPKGIEVVLPDGPVDAPSPVLALGQILYGFEQGMTYLSPAPLYHSAPLRFTMAVQRLGGTVIVMEHFDPLELLRLIEAHSVTHLQVVPTMFVRLLKLSDEERASADVSSLRCVIHAAAPCPVPVKERMIEWWGPIIHEYYAGTEGNGFCAIASEDWLAHRGSVGRNLLGATHILDDEGNELGFGEVGTVYFEGGPRFEYHNDPEQTAGSRSAQGWSTLGDIGRLDQDGYLYLTDRKANMIISGGVNVYPQETEDVLTLHPKVADVAVFGV
ncbi:MAG: AMP-binding protein, partial [Acidimicrobiia bacterium]|nr:AMP-binding protein [Acidimicrobiia bacterium]